MSIQLITPEILGIDYNKLEYKTFCIVGNDKDGEYSFICEYDYIVNKYKDYLPYILEANADNKHHIGFDKEIGVDSVNKASYAHGSYTEIQWD